MIIDTNNSYGYYYVGGDVEVQGNQTIQRPNRKRGRSRDIRFDRKIPTGIYQCESLKPVIISDNVVFMTMVGAHPLNSVPVTITELGDNLEVWYKGECPYRLYATDCDRSDFKMPYWANSQVVEWVEAVQEARAKYLENYKREQKALREANNAQRDALAMFLESVAIRPEIILTDSAVLTAWKSGWKDETSTNVSEKNAQFFVLENGDRVYIDCLVGDATAKFLSVAYLSEELVFGKDISEETVAQYKIFCETNPIYKIGGRYYKIVAKNFCKGESHSHSVHAPLYSIFD